MSHFQYQPDASYALYLATAGEGELAAGAPQRQAELLLGSPEQAPECFHWAKPESLLQLPALAQSLTELKHAARNPEQMWALDQFDLARAAYAQGAFPEALAAIVRGLRGQGERSGYLLDFRFHFLLGLIRLGSFRQATATMIDHAEAEQSFATAARYASDTHPVEAAWASLAAGWSCYTRGLMELASAHIDGAIASQSSLAPAHFLAAKVRLRRGEAAAALQAAAAALRIDPSYAGPVLRDRDFLLEHERCVELVEQERQARGQTASGLLKTAQELAARFGAEAADASEFIPLEELAPALAQFRQAREFFRANTLYGYLAAGEAAHAAVQALASLVARCEKAERFARDAIEEGRRFSAEIADVCVGPYRLGTMMAGELERARQLLVQAENASRSGRLGDSMAAEQHALQAQALLKDTIKRFQSAATALAEADRERILEHLARRHRATPEGAGVKAAALVGAAVCTLPGVYLGVISPQGATAVQRVMTVVIVIGLGAIVGALFAPYYRTPPPDGSDDAQLAAVDRTLEELRALPSRYSGTSPRPKPEPGPLAAAQLTAWRGRAE